MEPDDAPWLNLSPEEIQELRSKKQQLTEYGKQKIRELIKQGIEEYKPALEQLATTERQELINEALEELNAIVMGGQDTREFYLSVSHIRKVLESLK